ncbi:protein kinase [Nocardioides sp. MAH-18]|uniref:non-specific serine/threonine protein kinase n=1 Tax=Nocardioides agri TaxID=2682843 RepID=A0A6L6XUL7_9ACTN|nr:serine/threonine-protein kinase [Nocardioides sp. CGMCC 1.13656]MBA2955899.1 serine/threonine protein kinase [Nocardioides sp. CGMCC 1.13656]MVQ50748.1 protein kinase [Nocardioides sp. MAH-18]
MAPEIIAGRYVVLRAVGRGGMGTVWLCRDERLGREVAVKQVGVLPGESVPDPARALREARSLASLHHPYVVGVFDAIEADDHIWLVMEYVAGETLSELVAREGRLDPARVAAIGAQVADGLAAAHARGIVHRDVKPGNVLMAGDVAKISDFGIARTAGDAQLTRSGLVMGTPLYFSPELARGAEPTPAADVWALGVTLYTAVEGAPPFADRGNALATLGAIAEARPPHPDHAGFLAPAIGRMLDPDPTSRWSMADAAHALGRLQDQDRGPSTLATTAPVAVGTPVSPRTDDLPAPPGTEGRSRWPLLVGALVLLLLAGIGGVLLMNSRGPDPSADESSDSGTPSADASSTPGSATPSASSRSTAASAATPTPSASPTPTPSTTPAPPVPAGGGAARTVSTYYGLLPADTERAWSMLGEDAQAQAGGYDRYAGFWRTIDDVTVNAVSADGDVVTAELTYATDRGQEGETRQLQVERSGGGWVITEDLGPVGS